jgi:tripeptidyl-peptidase-1
MFSVGGVPDFVGGTSASAPIVASIITLINEQRLAAGKSTVGFINPTIYQNPDAFTDVRTFLQENFRWGNYEGNAITLDF